MEEMLLALDDEYMSARADDVRDLGLRLACRITGQPYPSLTGLNEDCVVAAHELLPSMLDLILVLNVDIDQRLIARL